MKAWSTILFIVFFNLTACSSVVDPLPSVWNQKLINNITLADIEGEYENRGDLTDACRYKHPNMQFVIRLAQILQFDNYKDDHSLIDPTTVKISILNNEQLKIQSYDQDDLIIESIIETINSDSQNNGWIRLKKFVDFDDDREFTLLDILGNTHSVESMKVSLRKTQNNELLVKLNLYHSENTLFIPLVSNSAECYGLFRQILL